jgi:sortase (surface protein transpeptidase)
VAWTGAHAHLHAGRRAGPATRLVHPAVQVTTAVRAAVSRPAGAPEAGPPTPDRVEIPSIGLSAAVATLPAAADLAVPVPADPDVAGWYAGGPSPGEVEPAVVVGHLDLDRGPGVFWRLAEARPGDEVRVHRLDGTEVRFAVARVARFPRAAFPSAEVYGATGDPELRLITCGGAFNQQTRQYDDNVVVFATAI